MASLWHSAPAIGAIGATPTTYLLDWLRPLLGESVAVMSGVDDEL
jgi:hypothetical protein